MIGSVIKHYRVEEVIGDGGMGVVYRGTDLNLDRPVALKILHPQLFRDPELRERFLNEARIQARLSHPGIVAVYDFDPDSGTIVMEYVPGRGLDELIKEAGGPIPYDRCVEIFRQVLQAIGFAHAHSDALVPDGIVHRDIKPSNILIVEVGGQTLAKVADFGIAKIMGGSKRLTSTRSQMGTLWYMSPEQIRSPKYVGFLSDVYSLGITLYETATGTVPFEGDTDFDLMNRILTTPPPAPSLRCSNMSPGLEQVIQKAIAKEPKDRFLSCDEFLQALLKVDRYGVSGGELAPPGPETVAGSPVLEPEQGSVTPEVTSQSSPRPWHFTDDFLPPVPSGRQDASLASRGQAEANWFRWAAAWGPWVVGVAAIAVAALVYAFAGGSSRTTDARWEPSITPEEVIKACARADSRKDAVTVAGFYAQTVQQYSKARTNGYILNNKQRVYARYDLGWDTQVSNIEVTYNGERSRALVEYDLIADWQGTDAKPFYCDIRKRVRMVKYEGQWRIDCEEDRLIRQASRPDATGTDRCRF